MKTSRFIILLLIAHALLVGYRSILQHNSGTGTPFSAVQTIVPSSSLHRLSQYDSSEYASQQEYYTWSASACSATAMTEVINYYGRSLRITNVLLAERNAGAITPELGLLETTGIARTVTHFGFHATIDYTHTLAQVIALANAGTPVIVSIPPQRSSLFYHGHLLVVTGGDASMVFLADSSEYNLQALSLQSFLYLWGGLAAIVTP
jgi:ABC-type bacteriocin/lantibiotic exporter with double-glycine peptidase domain